MNAERFPDKEAIVFRGASITYRELEQRSNQLAHGLIASGVRTGDRVGLYLAKSIESIIGIFGIMKAGAAYVPMDPSAPAKRLAFIAKNSAMRALVSTANKAAELLEELPSDAALECVFLAEAEADAETTANGQVRMLTWRDLAGAPAEAPPDTGAIEDDLAYILYTSGSTGEPKGVMISHRAALTFADWGFETFQVQASDRFSNHAPFHFDLSTFDVFVSMKAGATTVLVPEELSVFPTSLADYIEEHRISIWYSVPSVLTRLVQLGGLKTRTMEHLRAILFAGEVFPVKHLRGLMALIPHAEYYNLYGPTETNVCTFYKVDEIEPDRTDPVPIGKACANTKVFAVGDDNRVVQAGEIGELYVRGPSLMQGYWGLPEKTKTALISNTVLDSAYEDQVYRTGDHVKLDENGDYLFLGRRDHQIKSRGYRIELGEIETTLYNHPEVLEAAVIAIPDEDIGNAIKAVVVPKEGAQLTRGGLEHFCSERIPKYMIPGMIEFRPALPKTSTGKTDKTRLVREGLEAQPSLTR